MLAAPSEDPVARLAQDVGRALGGGYEVEEVIGRGGYAVVFRVHDRGLDRKLAAKALFPEFAAVPSIAERFRREAQMAARLTHPNIVPIYFVGREGDVPCLVMPRVEGETLAARLRREGQLATAIALSVARDVAAALDFAHLAGVVHRDVKPDNVLLEFATGRSLLTDFGIAKALASDSVMTASGIVIGTPHYVSPEQATGDRDLDARSDIYSLGVVIYEMLAGAPPFDSKTVQGIFAQHASAPVPSLRGRRPDVTEEMEAVMLRALAKDPAERFPTAGVFVHALEEAAGGRSLRKSGGTLVEVQDTGDASLFRTLNPAAAGAMVAATDVSSMVEAAGAAEARAIEAVDRVDGRDLLEHLRALGARAGDPYPALRAPVRDALIRLARHDGVVETLAATWRRGDERQQAAAEEALALLLPDCAEILLRLARRDRSPELILLADRVGALDDAGADQLAKDASGGVVQAFATALGESLRPTQTIQRWLAAAARHPNAEVRAHAVRVAAARGGVVAEHVGRIAAGDPAPAVRLEAIRALGASRRREAVPALAAMLERGSAPEQLGAAEALGSVPARESVTLLLGVFERTRLLKKERGPLQAAAARSLARLPAELAREALARLAQDKDPTIAGIARGMA
jgi:HEAT repeat protein/predicted Ser/Thr protein kinase